MISFDEIMEEKAMNKKYEFTKDLETGNALIDREHRKLFDVINELMTACAAGKGKDSIDSATKFLINYVDEHFTHEEELQKWHKYPGYASHHTFHENYKKKLREVVSKIPAAGPSVGDIVSINGQVGVLISHIRIEDKKLANFIKDK